MFPITQYSSLMLSWKCKTCYDRNVITTSCPVDRPIHHLPATRSHVQMSRLQRFTPSPSYSPLSQHSHVDDDGHIIEKQTAFSSHGQGKRHIFPWLQLAIILVLLLLAATAGFFLARCFPQTRLVAPSLPHTVPQGSSSSPALRLPSADSSSFSHHRLIQRDVPV